MQERSLPLGDQWRGKNVGIRCETKWEDEKQKASPGGSGLKGGVKYKRRRMEDVIGDLHPESAFRKT